MRNSRFTEAQIIGILKQAEGGAKVGDFAREHSASIATIYHWRSKYGGLARIRHERVIERSRRVVPLHSVGVDRRSAVWRLSSAA